MLGGLAFEGGFAVRGEGSGVVGLGDGGVGAVGRGGGLPGGRHFDVITVAWFICFLL
jgi:hypothetical protein